MQDTGRAALYTPPGCDTNRWWRSAEMTAEANGLQVVTFVRSWTELMTLIWCGGVVAAGIIISRSHVPDQPLLFIDEHHQQPASGPRRPQIRRW